MKDIKPYLICVKGVGVGNDEICPFILAWHGDKRVPVWLEWVPRGGVSQAVSVRTKHQTLESYRQLPSLKVKLDGQPFTIYQASISEMGEHAVAQFDEGSFHANIPENLTLD